MRTMPDPLNTPVFNTNRSAEVREEPKSGYRFVRATDGQLLKPHPYLVKGLIRENSVFVIFGAPSAGKTFSGVDLACSIANNKKWFGYETARGDVIYIATEGNRSLSLRIQGWSQAKMLPNEKFLSPFVNKPEEFGLAVSNDVDELIRGLNKQFPAGTIKLIIIDTLSNAIPGVDENNQGEMSKVLAHCRRIAKKTGAAVGLLHHPAKGNPTTPRGSSTFRAYPLNAHTHYM